VRQKEFDEDQSLFQQAALSSQRDASLLQTKAAAAQAASEDSGFSPWLIGLAALVVVFLFIKK